MDNAQEPGPFVDAFNEAFEKKWGYRLTDHLPSLFAPVGDHHKVRHQYWRTVTEMSRTIRISTNAQWI